jgi:hypothetical protein
LSPTFEDEVPFCDVVGSTFDILSPFFFGRMSRSFSGVSNPFQTQNLLAPRVTLVSLADARPWRREGFRRARDGS